MGPQTNGSLSTLREADHASASVALETLGGQGTRRPGCHRIALPDAFRAVLGRIGSHPRDTGQLVVAIQHSSPMGQYCRDPGVLGIFRGVVGVAGSREENTDPLYAKA